MLDREQRQLLVVPYASPPPPRGRLAGAALLGAIGALSVLGLFMADYSAEITAGLVVVGTMGFLGAVILFAAGVTARHRFRQEMEPAIDPVPVDPVKDRSGPAEAI
jgi:hypothetical protein